MHFKPVTCASALALAALIGSAALAGSSADVTRVELGQSGIAQFTLTANTTGRHLEFTVPQSAASDILASLVVRDPSGAVVDLQTDTPGSMSANLKGSPFEGGLPGDLVSLLGAVIGTDLALHDQSGTMRGRLVGVASPESDGEGKTYPTAMLLQDGALVEVVLAPGVRVDLPPDTARLLGGALVQAGSADETDMRRFDMTLEGSDTRDVSLSYVTEAPAWKNSYRLLLDQGRMQGWATVENISGHDWNDIALTLTTGVPVAYRSHLIDPRLIARKDMGDLLDKVRAVAHSVSTAASAGGGLLTTMSGSGGGAKAQAKHLSVLASGGARAFRNNEAHGVLRYDLPERIDLDNRRTTNLLYFDAAIHPRIHALYRGLASDGTVLLAVGFDSVQPLAPGLVSVQGSSGFVGDAPFFGSTAGQDVLLPVAVVSGAEIVSSEKAEVRVRDLVHSGGKLLLEAESIRTTTYFTPLPANVDRFTVEHPVSAAKMTAENAEVVRKTRVYQVTTPVADGTGKVEIVETFPVSREIDLNQKDIGRLVTELQAKNVTAPDRLKEPIRMAHDLLGQLQQNAEEARGLGSRYDALVAEQARLRSNLEIVLQDTLRARYTEAMTRTETRILRILDRQEVLQAADAGLKAELEAVFRDL